MEENKKSEPSLSELDCFELHYTSLNGLNIQIPTMIELIECHIYDYKQTWAEKKFGELKYKLKKNKANVNKFIVALLMLISVAFILGVVLGFLLFIHNEMINILLGVIAAQCMILAYYFWIGKFECNADYIRLKPKTRNRRK